MWILSVFWFLVCAVSSVQCNGLLLLYRPRDISYNCAFSERLRYDLSFGMGMSDTISLVLRSLSDIDYVCTVEITSEPHVYILIVIRFPGSLKKTCLANEDGFVVLKKNKCIRICDLIENDESDSPYYTLPVKGRVRFQFLSNSSINSEIDAHLYQLTATSARLKPPHGCSRRNETTCTLDKTEYCFTSGVVCDGIKNCGVPDWFDERKSKCGLHVERLGIAPVIAVVAAILFALLAASHILLRCLPPSASSYFIFNANEDNRLCIDSVFKSPGPVPTETERTKQISLIPVLTSSSSEEGQSSESIDHQENVTDLQFEAIQEKSRMKSITEKIQQKFLLATGRGKSDSLPNGDVSIS